MPTTSVYPIKLRQLAVPLKNGVKESPVAAFTITVVDTAYARSTAHQCLGLPRLSLHEQPVLPCFHNHHQKLQIAIPTSWT
ncbi:hypothetical protein DPMN_088680 [Dreissena polymorpha]|uniref:Uncharacterized protein n=1 Tax=Dreissena polymorpha TaxID=45954 RepID=A0A9D4KVH4_DREPO|nr:hypothetical protein DPMN_088680 [Dreissena polymorpha]